MSTPSTEEIIADLKQYAENSPAEMTDLVNAFAHMYFSSKQMEFIYSGLGQAPEYKRSMEAQVNAYLQVNPFPKKN